MNNVKLKEMLDFNSTYDQIRAGKINTMKEILLKVGEPFDKWGDILSEDELVKSFDFFNDCSDKDDDEDDDIASWIGYLDEIQNCNFTLVSKETLKILSDKGMLP